MAFGMEHLFYLIGRACILKSFQLEDTDMPGIQMASNVTAPKILGDIFESVAGAIFIDSGMSLDCVWKVYAPFLHDVIGMHRSH